MSPRLLAQFVRQFRGGPRIAGNFDLPADQFGITVLFGPSGCGKTTLLRCLAGLEQPDTGSIHFADEIWFDAEKRIHRTPQQRQIGYLFQDYALFPHLTVEDNIGYALRSQPRPERHRRVTELLERFDLSSIAQRFPLQTSGGQQQRTALARALARPPRLLLLDEPLSALDTGLREELRTEVRQVLSEFAIPVILVTHDRHEAQALGDSMIVLLEGQIRQSGPIQEIFSHPVDADVAKIVGMESLLPGTLLTLQEGLAQIRIGTALLTAVAPPAVDQSSPIGKGVIVGIRGEDVTLHRQTQTNSSTRNQFSSTVRKIIPEGPLLRVHLDAGFELSALITRPALESLTLQPGDTIYAGIKASAIHLILRNTPPAAP